MPELTPTQFARLQQAYLRASEAPPEQREALVRELIGDDPALLAEFRGLPDAENLPTAFLDPVPRRPPGIEDDDTSWSDPRRVGPVIGRYRLLTLLGHGGFGMVYEAEQSEPVRRRVALKIIKPGMDSRAVLNRFDAERQALALMDHPSIAKVYDGGTTGPDCGHSGLPYFVMELVRGDSITTFCDRERLTIERRIDLMIQVCEAVQHAHLKGVIHRDIKPSNVLVSYQDGKPVPKIIDFGIAKAVGHGLTEHTLVTHRGQLVGTPAYMSPEQAEMSGVDVDSRTDVYSLGVLLYEVLTSRPPFDPEALRSAGFAEMVRIIREVEPPRPSTRLSTLVSTGQRDDSAVAIARARRAELHALTRRLRTDLDWVVMKCLEKERDRRYTTARELAEELRRILAHQPVHAGPPRAAYRIRKFVRRNRVSVSWAGVVTLVACAGVVAFSALWVEYARAVREGREFRSRIANETALVTGSVRVDPMGFVRIEPDPWVAALLESYVATLELTPALQDARYEQIVRQTAALIEQAPTSRPDTLGVVKVLLMHADALGSLRRDGPRDLPLAERAYRRAIELFDRTGAHSRDAESVVMLARAHSGLGDVLRVTDARGALAAYERSRELLEGDVEVPADRRPEFERVLSRAKRDLAVALARVCRVDEAEQIAVEVLEQRGRAVVGAEPGSYAQAVSRRDVAVAATTLAQVRLLMNRPVQAAQSAADALRLREQILADVVGMDDERAGRNLGSFRRDVPVSRLILAECRRAAGDAESAGGLLEAAETELVELFNENTDDARMRGTLVECVLSQAELAGEANDAARALERADRAAALAADLAEGWERDFEYACRIDLARGSALRGAGRADEGIRFLENAVGLAREMKTRDQGRAEYERRLTRALLELAEARLALAGTPPELDAARALAEEAGSIYAAMALAGRSCGISERQASAPAEILDRIRSRSRD